MNFRRYHLLLAAVSLLTLAACIRTLPPQSPPTPTPRVSQSPFFDDFESGDLTAWSATSGLTVQQQIVAQGEWAARGTMSGSGAWAYTSLEDAVSELTASLQVRIVSHDPGSSAVNFLKVRTASGIAIAEVFVTAGGVLGVRNDVTGMSFTDTSVELPAGEWHTITLHARIDGTAGRLGVGLDGTPVPGLQLITDLGDTPIGRVQIGENVSGRYADLVYDSVVVTTPPPPPPPPPPGDRVLFADDFESGDLAAWTSVSELTVQNYLAAQGAWAARGTMSGSGAWAYKKLSQTTTEITTTVQVRVEEISGSSPVNFLKLRTEAGSAIAEVFVTTSGVLGVRNDVTGVSVHSATIPTPRVWHAVTMRAVIAGDASRLEIALDGEPVTSLQLTTDLGDTPIGRVQIGENVPGRTADLVYDSLTVSEPRPPPPPPPDGRVLFADDFESGDLAAWSAASGLTVQQQIVAQGEWAARGTMSGSGAWAYRRLGETTPELTADLQVRIVSHAPGSSAVNFLKVRTASGIAIAEVFVTAGGVLGVRNDVTGMSFHDTGVQLMPGAWHTITLHARIDGTAGRLGVGLDGTPVPGLQLITDLGDTPIGRVQIGENVSGRHADLAYDRVTVSVPPSGHPLLVAAGDIACDPANPKFNGGEGTSNACRQRAVSDLVLANPAVSAVAALGDVQYECGGAAAFAASYHSSWGRFRALTRPAVGNHEYLSDSGDGTDCDPSGNAAGYYGYFGSAAGDPDEGYYSYDLGSWHIIVLNSNCSDAGGCGPGSPQDDWLQADLAAHPVACTLAYWHIPLWSSGGRAEQNSRSFVERLYAAGADVVLAGHDHIYERFAKQDPDGAFDPERGLRAFVVGTGGSNHTTIPEIAANSEVREGDTFGVLELTLRPGGYDWRFVPEAGETFSDSGSDSCH